MPLYDYRCEKCEKVVELTFKMADKPYAVPCSCGAAAVPIVSVGGIQSDEPSWLYEKEVRGCLQKHGERPIENRKQYRDYLKANNIVER